MIVILLGLPSLGYALFCLYLAKIKQQDIKRLKDYPWVRLIGAGVALVALGLAGWATFTGKSPGGVYVPPSYEGGKVNPAHVTPPGGE